MSLEPAHRMSDLDMPIMADMNNDDLPRTLRREREARAREAQEREAAERAARLRDQAASFRENATGSRDVVERVDTPAFLSHNRNAFPYVTRDEPLPAAVRRIDVPFFSLVWFFLKATIAAIPALIMLVALLWLAGKGLQTYFPELIKLKILISFPNG